MTLGDVYWVEFPARGGREQSGRRPAVLFQSEQASTHLSTVLVVPLTTQIDALRFPGTVLVERDPRSGLRQNSVALVFQMTAIARKRLDGKLGELADEVVLSILTALDELIGRPGGSSNG